VFLPASKTVELKVFLLMVRPTEQLNVLVLPPPPGVGGDGA
jgi:hypothetical protein